MYEGRTGAGEGGEVQGGNDQEEEEKEANGKKEEQEEKEEKEDGKEKDPNSKTITVKFGEALC